MKLCKSTVLSLSKTTLVFWCSFFFWVGFVCFLSALSASKLSFLPSPFEGFDKVLHFVLFLVGANLFTKAMRGTVAWPWHRVLILSVLFLSLFGWMDEMHQMFTSGRSGGDLGEGEFFIPLNC